MGRWSSGLAVLALFASPAVAQSDLRELSTDRPDKTESPHTVDAGDVQIELDFATVTQDRTADERVETFALAPFNLKFGIGRNTDLQLVIAPYQRQMTTDERTGDRSRIAGFGDVTLRLKHNLWGNDGGPTALALMPFITLPTGREGLGAEGVEFGLIVPLAITLSDGIDLGLMTQINATRADGRYRATFINSATLGFTLTDRIGIYAEIYTEFDPAAHSADMGLTYAVGDNAQFDLGANLGLTDAADDMVLFIGFSRKF